MRLTDHVLSLLLVPIIVHASAKKNTVLLIHSVDEPTHLKSLFERSGLELNRIIASKNYNEQDHHLIDPYGDGRFFDNLLLMVGQLPKKLSSEELVEFVRRGGNIFWALPSGLKILDQRTIAAAREFGRVLDEVPAKLHDYFGDTNAKEVVADPRIVRARAVKDTTGRIIQSADLYDVSNAGWIGTSHRLDIDNPLVFPILTASTRAYASCTTEASPSSGRCNPTYGTDNILASALETRISSRVTILAGDNLLRSERVPKFIEELLSWTFQESGMLRATVEHHKLLSDPSLRQEGYRVGDRMEVRVCVTLQKSQTTNNTPFQPNDMQVELRLMETMVRVDLIPTPDGCLTSGVIQLPSKHGIYTLAIRYQRRGYSHFIHNERIVIRTLKHDEYPRVKYAATPYYIAWLLLLSASGLMLYPLIYPTPSK